ncbi:MAG: hypothetical protein K2I10_06865 [Lachnospiraceae bacterium]|nr:hypothetical protein [Lachnospiraceae bacterium]
MHGLFENIYSVYNGTDSEIKEQRFFEFLIGFRLMTVDEIIEKYENIFRNSFVYEIVIPFLADYMHFYYAYVKEKGKKCIVYIYPEETTLMHANINPF